MIVHHFCLSESICAFQYYYFGFILPFFVFFSPKYLLLLLLSFICNLFNVKKILTNIYMWLDLCRTICFYYLFFFVVSFKTTQLIWFFVLLNYFALLMDRIHRRRTNHFIFLSFSLVCLLVCVWVFKFFVQTWLFHFLLLCLFHWLIWLCIQIKYGYDWFGLKFNY